MLLALTARTRPLHIARVALLSALVCPAIMGRQACCSPVSAQSALGIARRFVGFQASAGISGWKGAPVSPGPRLLSASGRTAAYTFCVGGGGHGYLLVSGDSSMPPVLEWSPAPQANARTSSQALKQLRDHQFRNRMGGYRLCTVLMCPGLILSRVQWQMKRVSEDSWLDHQDCAFRQGRFPSSVDPTAVSAAGAAAWGGYWRSLTAGMSGGMKVATASVNSAPWFPPFRSSHVAATGMALALLGTKPKSEPVKGYLARLGNFIEHCLCDRPDKPMTSIITAGAANFCRLRGMDLSCREYVVRGAGGAPKFTFADYRRAIGRNRPVVLTYSADPQDRREFEHARLRLGTVSALGYGFRSDQTGNYAMVYLPSACSGDGGGDHLPSIPTRPGLVFVNWDAPTASTLAVVFEGTRRSR